MKIICISDTHGQHRKLNVPDGDILIHAGDITFRGEFDILRDFNIWLGELPHRHKIYIAGNHDITHETKNAKSLITNATYLQDSSIVIDSIKFYGSPWTPRFFDWAFNADRGSAIRKIWNKIPIDTNVLITHGPVYGILDTVPNGLQVGCSDLKDRIKELPDLKLHVCGHVHNGYGIETADNVMYINSSTCTESYSPKNKCIVIDL
jgi:Icc-related predicted phosphoesterase